ncbi:MAG: hypothetical protein KDG52_03770 [Rhodocyclaceae bacterium]|nr:hypothetical protein [Rhodocyclaceae bacterium]
MKSSAIIVAAALATLTVADAPAQTIFGSGNVLVSSSSVISEFDFDGRLISRLTIPPNADNEASRDLIVLEDGRLAVFNGTFRPELSVFDGLGWAALTMDGWSTPNNVSYGGVAAIGDQVIVTDGMTYNGGEARGLILLDLVTASGVRFVDSSDYIDVTTGLDGLIYALRDVYGNLDVFDAASLAPLRSVALGHTANSRSVTADAEGTIFMVSWDGYVARYDATGVLQKTLTIGGNLHDIDIDLAGHLVVGSRFGNAYLTDTSLDAYRALASGSSSSFVAFVPTAGFAPPVLAGNVARSGPWIVASLAWETGAESVDVYLNEVWIDQVAGNTATYRQHRKDAQVYKVCNAGTDACSGAFIAN